MNINNPRKFYHKNPLYSLLYIRPVPYAAVLSRQDLQKIVAQMVG